MYYDKSYDYGLTQRNSENIFEIKMDCILPEKNAEEILQFANKITIKSEIDSTNSTNN